MVQSDDENDRILWCGNLHEKVTEEVLYELFLQAGPLEKVKLVSGNGPRFAFITFQHRVSVPYTIELMNGIRLFDRPLRLQHRTGSAGSSPSASSSAPGTPVGPPLPLMPQSHVRPQNQLNPMSHMMAPPQMVHALSIPPLNPQQIQWFGNPPAGNFVASALSSTPTGFNAPPFQRSSSEPESIGAMRNGRRTGFSGGQQAERTPYARPSGDQRHGFAEPSPILAQNIEAQLRAMRQNMTPRSSGSNYRRDPPSSRDYNGGGGSRRYR